MLQRSLTSSLIVLSLVSAAAAMDNPPTGYGKAKFGASPAQVEKLYPGQIKVLGQESLGATPVFSPYIVRQSLSDQKVLGLEKPVTVELRYWKDQLWVVIVYYGANDIKDVNEALRKQYGKPNQTSSDQVWQTDKVLLNTANRERWYAISDNAIAHEAQVAFMEEMRKMQEKARGHHAQAPEEAPDAAAPPPPAPAGK